MVADRNSTHASANGEQPSWRVCLHDQRSGPRTLLGADSKGNAGSSGLSSRGQFGGGSRSLLRVVDHHEPLNATWRSLSWITPSDLMPILAAVRATYGRDTALQGWTYRHMVYLFGIKQEQHLEHFEPQPHRFEQLQKALNEPSLYDDVLAFLSRRGFKIPAE